MSANNNNTKARNAMRDPRHRKFRMLSTTLTVLVIVGILLLNVIVGVVAKNFPLSIDMSSDKVFTLSDESRKVAESVSKGVEVVIFTDTELFFSQMAQAYYETYLTYYGVEVNLSNEFERVNREIETSLAQLHSHSDGKITYSFIVPDQEPEKYAEYSKYNLGQNNVLFISAENPERYRKTTLDTMFTVPDDLTYVSSNVEKVLVSSIYALQGEDDRIIQVLTGHEEDQYTIDGLQHLYELNGYIFEELKITGSAEINEKAEALLIAAPFKDYTEQEIQRIRTWLKNDNKRNRHLLVYVHPTADCPNLYEMLKTDYRIEVTDQLIYESDPNRYHSDGERYNFAFVSADVVENDYTKNSGGIANVIMPMTRRLICPLPSSADGIAELGIPLTTHPDTASVSRITGSGDKLSLDKDDYPLTSSISYVFESFDDNTQQAATTTVTVCGSAMMAYDYYIQDANIKNEELMLDIIRSVTGYETNISISNKVIAKNTTQFKSGTQMILGIGVFTVGLPVVVLVICLVVFLRRRSL